MQVYEECTMTMLTNQNHNRAYVANREFAASGSVSTSLQQLQHAAGMHKRTLFQQPQLSRSELTRVAQELMQVANDLGQVTRTRSQFLGTVAHELRTPLTIAKGWLSILRYGKLHPDQERAITVVDAQIEELARLVNDILDVSQQEAGALALDLEVVDVVGLVQQIVEHQSELALLQGIQLTVQAHTANVYASVDRGRITQVLHNLINNACRYVPQDGTGTIELIIAVTDTTVQISVRDNGTGIAAEHLPHIFQPFYQIAGRTRGKSGLGLTLVHDLVRAHGGMLTVESSIGQGTTFHIWLQRTMTERNT